MADYQSVRSNRLTFKGDKKHKKKPKKEKSAKRDRPEAEEPITGWTAVQEMGDLEGPVCLFFPSDPVRCLALNEDTRAIECVQVGEAGATLPTVEPVAVNQVFVIHAVRNTGSTSRSMLATGPEQGAGGSASTYTLRTCDGRYLSVRPDGILTADALAVGPPEMWVPVLRPEGLGLQSVHDTFIGVDYEPQQESIAAPMAVACREDTMGFCQTLSAKCQARTKPQRRAVGQSGDDATVDDLGEYELDQMKTFQSRTNGSLHRVADASRVLKRARKEGRVAEALLDRREKLKSDKFCK